jgi:hypothetical protein
MSMDRLKVQWVDDPDGAVVGPLEGVAVGAPEGAVTGTLVGHVDESLQGGYPDGAVVGSIEKWFSSDGPNDGAAVMFIDGPNERCH